MAFPTTPLDLRVEIDVGGWTDVSSTANKAYQRAGTTPPVIITRGRPDESARVNASSAQFQVNNRNGNFSPKNPLGAWFGQLGRNTPVRFSVPAQVNYMRIETDTTSYASSPLLPVSGDQDIRIDLHPTSYQFAALAGMNVGGTGPSWLLQLEGDGTLLYFWWDNGGNRKAVRSTLPVPLGRVALRATLAVATGTVTFYTAPNISGSWTQLGAAASGTGGALTSVFAGTAPVRVGDNASACAGAYYGFQVLNGIGGSIVGYANFTAQAAGATSWTDAESNTWTLNGTAEISNRNYRYHGELSSLPPKWDTTATDLWMPVTASGVLRRIGQGSSPLQSPMNRAIASQSGTLAPVQFWPCEDAAGATAFGSATGGPLMTWTGTPALSSDTSFLAAAPLPVLSGSAWRGLVLQYTSNGSIVVRFLARVGTVPGSGSQVLLRLITTGSLTQQVDLSVYNGGGLGLAAYSGSSTTFNTGGVSWSVSGEPLWYSVELTPSGANLDYAITTVAPGASSGLTTTGSVSTATIGLAAAVYVNPDGWFTDTAVGEISVQSAWSSLFNFAQPLNAWQGEKAGDRFLRLCGENGFTARIIGAPDVTAAMGAQSVTDFGSLIQECEDADQGQVFEPRQCLGLGYRTLASMLNQAPAVTLDYSLAEIGGTSRGAALEPTYDDQYTRNDVTVTRSSGTVSGATYEYVLDDGSAMSVSAPPAGVGDYATSVSANVELDSQLPDIAGWQVHLGTVDEARWPVIPVNLARPAIQASSLYYPLLGLDIGDFAELVNLLNQVTYDPVKQLAFQVTESLGGFFHELEITGVPESPYEVIVLDDPVYGRVDTDGSVLHANATSAATSITVDTSGSNPLWTTAAADFPFDIRVAGERVTVTNITGSSSPQTFTVTRSVNGVVKAQTAGTDVRLWFPPILSLI